jgi:serine/threonine-protein kinase
MSPGSGKLDDPASGAVIAGKYALLDLIGEGGMSRVWRARRVVDERKLAVKFVTPAGEEEGQWPARFRREARLLVRLGARTRHVVKIEDYGFDPANGPFIAMELLSGETLAARLAREQRLPTHDAVRIVNELCAALTVAHRAGVVHRDVKPSNVFLHRPKGGHEQVKLLDFGVAKTQLAGDLTSPTREGVLLGTPQYMSPEQFMGEPNIDARADLWSVGVLAYCTLVGHAPFSQGPQAELAARILGQNPPPPSSLVPGVSPRVDAWFQRALAKRPGDRFSDAREMCAAFEAALEADAAEPPRPSRPPPVALLDFRVKGAALRATLNVLRKLDETLLERTLDRCSPDTARVLKSQLLVSSYYPGSLFVEVSRAAVHFAGPGILRKLGELSAEEALGPGGVFELFIKLSRGRGAARFLQSSQDIFRLYYDRGAWRVEELGESSALCRFVEGARFPPEVVERLLGYLDRGLALVGARNVEIRNELDEPDLIVRVAWQPSPEADLPSGTGA